MKEDYQLLQSALHLPTHEQALDVFMSVADINVSYKNDGYNILHDYIVSYSYDSGKELRIKDFYTLIQLGVKVNGHSSDGLTPLHMSCIYRNYEAAKILIENGAEIDSIDEIGRTPLFIAIGNYRGEKDVLKIILLLLEKGADLDKPNNYSKTPRNKIKIVNAMIEAYPSLYKSWDLSEYIKSE
jgi:ankyrin repeat protein